MEREEMASALKQFINEMERTLNDKKNKRYAPEVFWKNKYTLEMIVKELEVKDKTKG